MLGEVLSRGCAGTLISTIPSSSLSEVDGLRVRGAESRSNPLISTAMWHIYSHCRLKAIRSMRAAASPQQVACTPPFFCVMELIRPYECLLEGDFEEVLPAAAMEDDIQREAFRLRDCAAVDFPRPLLQNILRGSAYCQCNMIYQERFIHCLDHRTVELMPGTWNMSQKHLTEPATGGRPAQQQPQRLSSAVLMQVQGGYRFSNK